MGKTIRGWWWEALCLAIYFALAGVQLFKTPIIGLADNGDFPKVLGRLDVCGSNQYYKFISYKFRIDPECRWDSHIATSESLFVRVIKQFSAWNQDYEISVRAAGKTHLMVVLAAFAILLWALHQSRPAIRFGLPPFIVLIFSDVAYVAYLNSFYMDAAAMVFLMLTVSLACAAILRPQPWIPIAFAIAAVGFVTSKSQHAILGVFFAALALVLCSSSRLWILSAVAILAATASMTARTDLEYRTYPLYNLIFFHLAKDSPDPAATLAELGLPSTYLPLVGTHSYTHGVPSTDAKWQAEFFTHTSYSKLLAYYLRHPRVVFDQLWRTLSADAPDIRWIMLGNYLQKDGFPPGTLTNHFSAWSSLRSWLFRVFPLHAVLLYLLVFAGCMRYAEWPLYPVCLLLAICGVTEFAGAALLDCLETARHLFLFHVITDMLILFCAALVTQASACAFCRATYNNPSSR